MPRPRAWRGEHRKGPAQHPSRPAHVASGHQRRGSPNWKPRGRAPALPRARARQTRAPRPVRSARSTPASAPCPKRKLPPLVQPANAQRSARILRTKSPAERFGERRVEGQHHNRVDARPGQQPHPFGHRRQQPRRLRGAQKLLRVRIEGDGDGARSEPRASSTTAERISRWPRCTPSKLPIAATEGPNPAGISAIERNTGFSGLRSSCWEGHWVENCCRS